MHAQRLIIHAFDGRIKMNTKQSHFSGNLYTCNVLHHPCMYTRVFLMDPNSNTFQLNIGNQTLPTSFVSFGSPDFSELPESLVLVWLKGYVGCITRCIIFSPRSILYGAASVGVPCYKHIFIKSFTKER